MRRSHVSPRNRKARQESAAERVSRTPQEQLAELDRRGMKATKERAKIARKISKISQPQKKGKKNAKS